MVLAWGSGARAGVGGWGTGGYQGYTHGFLGGLLGRRRGVGEPCSDEVITGLNYRGDS